METDKTIYYCYMCQDTYDDQINTTKCKGKECINTCCPTCDFCSFNCQRNLKAIIYQINLLKDQLKDLEILSSELTLMASNSQKSTSLSSMPSTTSGSP